jgi:two-component system, NtrC family, sensor kinase
MSSRSRRAVSKPSSESSGEPSRETLLAALAERERELAEAREQQAATADVLKVISRATFDLPSVLDTLMETAARLCDIEIGGLTIRDGEVFRYAAFYGFSDEVKAVLLARPIIADRATIAGRVALEGKVVQVADLATDPDYDLPELIKLGNIHTTLGVPLLRKGAVVGAITVSRQRVAPFTKRQVELLCTFADQAVIAIENVRLLEAEQRRSGELAESLQRQTATAEVLKVISRSAFDLQPVLETLISSAVELSGVLNGAIVLREGDVYRYRATSGIPSEFAHFLKEHPPKAGRASMAGRVILSGRVERVPDVLEDKEYAVPTVALNQTRSLLGVPLLRNDKVEGALVLARTEPGEFAPRIIELVQTFADQAVIAIENVRLFDEVQARTRDLSEALQQQTATSEVLKVISRSAFDLDAVLSSLTKSAVELCNSTYGVISLYRNGVLEFMAQTGCTPEFAELLWRHPAQLDRKSVTGRTGLLRTVVLVPDVTKDEDYDYHGGEIIGNYRSCMGVPLLRNAELEGVFTLMRREPGLFTPRQVDSCKPSPIRR